MAWLGSGLGERPSFQLPAPSFLLPASSSQELEASEALRLGIPAN